MADGDDTQDFKQVISAIDESQLHDAINNVLVDILSFLLAMLCVFLLANLAPLSKELQPRQLCRKDRLFTCAPIYQISAY